MSSDATIPAYIALAGLSQLEMAIVVACLTEEANPSSKPLVWAHFADELDTDKQTLCRSRIRLERNGRLKEKGGRYSVNHDPTVWIDHQTKRGSGLVWLVSVFAEIVESGTPARAQQDTVRPILKEIACLALGIVREVRAANLAIEADREANHVE